MILDDVKKYAAIDNEDDDTQVNALISAAEAYMTNAGIAIDEDDSLYCLAVEMLVTHWYDNRGAIVVGTITKTLEYSLQSIIAQLKYKPVVIE